MILRRLDLNADLGEGVGDDAALISVITSASIACGGHAGDEYTMRAAVRFAHASGVRIGAHPGFADRENFGRRRLELPLDEVIAQVVGQVRALAAVVRDEGSRMSYVKLHGALANMAAEDEQLAKAVFEAIEVEHPGMAILALAESAQQRAAETLGLRVIAEAYADRAYTADGLLASRDLPGAVIHDPPTVVERCRRLAETGEIVAIDGTTIATSATSICLHGDTEGAMELARMVRSMLESIDALDSHSKR